MTDAIIVFCAISAVALVVIVLAMLQCNKRGAADSARFEQNKTKPFEQNQPFGQYNNQPFGQYNNQPFGQTQLFEQYKNPLQPASGSFTQTCRNCRGNANSGPGFMMCDCQDRSGKWVPTEIQNLRACKRNGMSPLVKNINGQLMCDGLR